MELEESTCLTSGSTTKPQSSRQYGTGTKTEIEVNGTKYEPEGGGFLTASARRAQTPITTRRATTARRTSEGNQR